MGVADASAPRARKKPSPSEYLGDAASSTAEDERSAPGDDGMSSETEQTEDAPGAPLVDHNGSYNSGMIERIVAKCRVAGPGLHMATVRQEASFTITAIPVAGQLENGCYDSFFISIRGASRVRATVVDNADGTYRVTYRPSCSGKYSISVSLFGISRV